MFKEGGIWPGKLSLWNLLCDKQHGRKSKTWLWFWLAALKEIGPLGRQKAAKWKPWHLEIVTPCSAVQAHRLLTWREGLHAAAGTRPKSRSRGLQRGVDAQPCCGEERALGLPPCSRRITSGRSVISSGPWLTCTSWEPRSFAPATWVKRFNVKTEPSLRANKMQMWEWRDFLEF